MRQDRVEHIARWRSAVKACLLLRCEFIQARVLRLFEFCTTPPPPPPQTRAAGASRPLHAPTSARNVTVCAKHQRCHPRLLTLYTNANEHKTAIALHNKVLVRNSESIRAFMQKITFLKGDAVMYLRGLGFPLSGRHIQYV